MHVENKRIPWSKFNFKLQKIIQELGLTLVEGGTGAWGECIRKHAIKAYASRGAPCPFPHCTLFKNEAPSQLRNVLFQLKTMATEQNMDTGYRLYKGNNNLQVRCIFLVKSSQKQLIFDDHTKHHQSTVLWNKQNKTINKFPITSKPPWCLSKKILQLFHI